MNITNFIIMKKSATGYILAFIAFIGILLGVAWECSGQKPCDFVIPLATFQYNAASVKPGQTICFAKGTRGPAEISNMVGTPEAPIVLTNEPSGKTIIKGSGAKNSQGFYTTGFLVNFLTSSNFVVQGKNNPAEDRGLEFHSAHMGVDFKKFSTDFEVYGLWIHDVSCVGIVAKTDVTCDVKTQRGNFTMKNVYIHDNLVENVGCEGTYIGNSHYTNGQPVTCSGISKKLLEHDVYNVRVINNKFLSTGQDGVQIGACLYGLEVIDNVIENYGNRNVKEHLSGLQLNLGSAGGLIYNNKIDRGKGFGIFLGGSGGFIVRNNLVISAEQGAMLISDFAPIVRTGFIVENNTYIDSKDYLAWINNQNTIGNIFRNNISASTRITKGITFNLPTQKPTWFMDNNIITSDLASLKLDSAYVPTKDSPLNGLNVGYKQRVEVIEKGWEVIRVDGVFYFEKDGERVKL